MAFVGLNGGISMGCKPRSGISGLQGRSVFNLVRNLWTVFPSACINLDSYQQRVNSSCFTFLSALGIVSLFHSSHSAGRRVVIPPSTGLCIIHRSDVSSELFCVSQLGLL